MDEITKAGLTILTSALGGAAVGGKLIEKLIGPTTDYIGLELKAWTEMRVNNVARIFKKANEKLGENINQPGSIPPRVLKEILEEGSYCDNELMAEYYGGILASGRSPDGKDDRAISYLKLTSGLSASQIRLHYIAYTVFHRQYGRTGLRPSFADDLEKMATFFPWSLLTEAMDIKDRDLNIIIESSTGLDTYALLEPIFWGHPEHINKLGKEKNGAQWIDVDTDGIVYHPRPAGIDYYLWATGHGNVGRQNFLKSELKNADIPDVKIGENTKKVLK